MAIGGRGGGGHRGGCGRYCGGSGLVAEAHTHDDVDAGAPGERNEASGVTAASRDADDGARRAGRSEACQLGLQYGQCGRAEIGRDGQLLSVTQLGEAERAGRHLQRAVVEEQHLARHDDPEGSAVERAEDANRTGLRVVHHALHHLRALAFGSSALAVGKGCRGAHRGARGGAREPRLAPPRATSGYIGTPRLESTCPVSPNPQQCNRESKRSTLQGRASCAESAQNLQQGCPKGGGFKASSSCKDPKKPLHPAISCRTGIPVGVSRRLHTCASDPPSLRCYASASCHPAISCQPPATQHPAACSRLSE
eukprot:scaffold7730_cov70-Phaeocystis_antarctica.AAC.2